MKFYGGAWSHQRDNKTNVLASIERRTLAQRPVVMLVSLEGDMASIALELLKDRFAAIDIVAEATAATLVAAVPPMLAASVTVALLSRDTCFTATRSGACFLQRASTVALVGASATLQPGDYVIASTRSEPLTLATFAGLIAPQDEGRNDLLDDVLRIAVEPMPNVGIAAALAVG